MKMESSVVIAELQHFIQEGKNVVLPVDGRSMRPFIIGGKEKVEFHPLKGALHRGDVVLAKVDEGYYVVHRVVECREGRVILEGDGNLGFQEHCPQEQVIAQGIYVIDGKERKRSLVSSSAMRKWRWWMALKPIRRILLFIDKLICKIK